MELKLLSVTLLLTVVWLASAKAANLPEQYWKESLPSTRIPKAIEDILSQTYATNEDNTMDDTGSGVHPALTRGLVGAFVGVGSGRVSVSTGTRRGNFVSVGGTAGSNPFDYIYVASETYCTTTQMWPSFPRNGSKAHENCDAALHEEFKQGGLSFLRGCGYKTIFIEEVAGDIWHVFSETRLCKRRNDDTTTECEAPGIEIEEKYCATSLESMIDFCRTKLGKDIKAVSTKVNRQTSKQNYTVTEGARRVADVRSVACHKENYPYAVFYCHKTQDTRFYMVLMKGSDGTTVEAVIACHTDTSKWNPKHLAFQVPKVEPGTVPICHFLPEDLVVWFSN